MHGRIAKSFSLVQHWSHRHAGIALMPPDTVHYGRSTALTRQRGFTLNAAFRPPIRLVSRASHHRTAQRSACRLDQSTQKGNHRTSHTPIAH